MKRGQNRFLKLINGDTTRSFEFRQTYLITTAGALLALAATVINYFTNQSPTMTAVSLAAGILLLVLRSRLKHFKTLVWPTCILIGIGLVLGIIGWVTSSGIFGSAPFVFYLMLTWLLATRNSDSHLLLTASTVVVLVGLMLMQKYFPHLITNYPDATAQWSDLVAGILATLVFQALFISALRHQFEAERHLLNTEHGKLVETMSKLSAAQQAAENALTGRSDFLAAMSHELRTPLTSVIAGVRLLKDDTAEHSQEEIVGFIERSSQALLRLIDDLLVLRSHEAGEVSIVFAPFRLREFLSDITRYYLPLARNKGLDFFFSFDERLPDIVNGDDGRIGQILANLISNSIKYTERGQVTFKVALCESASESIVFEVSDSGVGIPVTEQADLFKPYVRANDVRRRIKGTGLGLSVCALLAPKLHGKIELVKSDSSGSTFRLTVPLRIDQMREATAQKNLTKLTRGLRILVAEDDEVNALLLSKILNKNEIECAIAHNGAELVRMANEGPWHMILTDIQMPDIDGFEAATRIQAALGPGNTPPIIAVSAANFEEDSSHREKSPIVHWLAKPYTEEALLNAIAQNLHEAQTQNI